MKNEATVQAEVRLKASRIGWGIWRNNVGVLLDSRGVPVRYGLANDSKGVNANVKSGDLIGIRTRIITPEMIGSTIGQFISRECKREGWKFNPNDPRDKAQQRWIDIINSFGGDAAFTTGDL